MAGTSSHPPDTRDVETRAPTAQTAGKGEQQLGMKTEHELKVGHDFSHAQGLSMIEEEREAPMSTSIECGPKMSHGNGLPNLARTWVPNARNQQSYTNTRDSKADGDAGVAHNSCHSPCVASQEHDANERRSVVDPRDHSADRAPSVFPQRPHEPPYPCLSPAPPLPTAASTHRVTAQTENALHNTPSRADARTPITTTLSAPSKHRLCPLIVPIQSADGSYSFPVSSLLPSSYITSISVSHC
ncbi:hypothetical protein JB92DRAFT_2831859 [Gautieria morchelliformis]|nr:hypothetical protein JB92DRAFT_2831859 [Gautieria morchelliformis]